MQDENDGDGSGPRESRDGPGGLRGPDRRKRPTPMLSRYWLTGRRRGGRRAGERGSIYVDRYTREEVSLTAWILLASALDLVLTLRHLSAGGGEANPAMNWALELGGSAAFAATKVVVTVGAVFFLLLHARFRGTRAGLWGLSLVYVAVLLYHVVAYLDRS